jgi:hypothetical protein
MAGRRINRSRAGIESAVLAVLLIIIAIAMASIVYLFASTQTQSLARTADIDIIDARYLSGTSSSTALVTVKNTGSVQVTINSITISSTGSSSGSSSGTCTISDTRTLNPGDTASFTSTSCPALSPGTKVTIVVEGKSVTGEQVKAVGQAVVM